MLNLCACNNVSKNAECVMNRFDLNKDGEVNNSELSQINLNSVHKSIYCSDSPHRNNKYFKRIDAENLRTAFDRNSDGTIDITDFNLLSHLNKIDEDIFSLVELIALADAFGEYKDTLREKVGAKRTYRAAYVLKAEQQLDNTEFFGELFHRPWIASPIPTNPY